MSKPMRNRDWISSAGSLPALVLALIPRLACPCAMSAYAGLLSSLGLTFLMRSTVLFPLTVAVLTFAVGSLAIGARRRHGYGPFALGLFAALCLVVGRFAFTIPPLCYLATVTLVVAAIWNVWPRKLKKVRFTPDGAVEPVD